MPAGHRPGSYKQKNKPFKGGSGKSKAHKVAKIPVPKNKIYTKIREIILSLTIQSSIM